MNALACPSPSYAALVHQVEKNGCEAALKSLLEENRRPSHPDETTTMEAICRHQNQAVRRHLLESVAAAVCPVGHGFWEHGLLDSAHGGLEAWRFVSAMGGRLSTPSPGMNPLEAVCWRVPASEEGAALVEHVLAALPAAQLTPDHLASAWWWAAYSANHRVFPVLEGHPAWARSPVEWKAQAARLVQRWHECEARQALRPSLSAYHQGLAHCLVHLERWVPWESVLGNADPSAGQALLKRLLLAHRLAEEIQDAPEGATEARPLRL